MKKLVAATSLALALLPFSSITAAADDPDAGAEDGAFWIKKADKAEDAIPGGRGRPSGGDITTSEPVAGSNGCAAADQIVGGIVEFSFCQQYAEPATPALTTGHVRRAFAELKLPAGEMVVQPPDGLTLVNFDTNFYTTTIEPITRTVRLLGRRVTLEATPSRYTWTFGDGQSLTTTDPGAPYPRLTITHNYLRTGTYRPALATTYTGRFRVGNGPWRQIPGTVTIDGTGQPLRAIEAEPKLVSY